MEAVPFDERRQKATHGRCESGGEGDDETHKDAGKRKKSTEPLEEKKAATTQKCQATAPGEDTKSYQAIDEIGNDVEDAVAATTH